eukprot:TRINITY_DN36461_c0_g3_i2.p1 TRINITY_DN36461_c0_g3~~TRINITY_DN36461_c0_g3_i2.p1  ORF type:complete len:426 (+),score=46.86 TRINITY_DN36461_c0_g3_i2:118-1395(+)
MTPACLLPAPKKRPFAGGTMVAGRMLHEVGKWICVFCATQLCSLPAMLNSFLDVVPVPKELRWLLPVQKFLPALGAVSTLLVQPKLLRGVAHWAKMPLQQAMIFQGVSTWMSPCLIVFVLSQDCYGLWWEFLPDCNTKREWQTGIEDGLLMCSSNLRFDVALELWSYNRTLWCYMPDDFYTTQAEVCKPRMVNPSKCTTRVLDVVGSYLLIKLLVACVLPPALLALCMQTSADRSERPSSGFPAGLSSMVSDDGVTQVEVVVSLGRCKEIRINISQKFSPLEVTQRLAVWIDFSLGWGLVCPPIALAGLLYIHIERWAYETVANRLCLRYAGEEQDEVSFPASVMILWLLMSNFLVALHFGSTATSSPSAMSVLALVAMLIAWLIGSWLSRRTPASENDLSVIELQSRPSSATVTRKNKDEETAR